MTGRPNLVLAVVAGVLAVVAVVAGVLAATRDAPQYEPGSPEAVVQQYLTAVVEGDPEGAADLLAPDSPCDVTDLDRAFVPDQVRISLREAETRDETARVVVVVATASGDLFDTSEYSEEHTLRLVRDGDRWRLAGAPWPLGFCGDDR